MFKKKNIFVVLAVFASLFFSQNFTFAQNYDVLQELQSEEVSQEIKAETSYPDYAYEFLGNDKFEKFNRKMFNFNMKMNKYALRPVHIIWASIMPKYGMERIQSIYENALYPRRLVSNLIQRDFAGARDETIRFLANSTIGLGGMFDPAKRYFNIESTDADMEQALAKCKMKSGPYLVCPVLSSASPRALVGKALDAALDPSSYVGIPFMSLVKLGFTINNTASMQPLAYLLEATYADPYDIMRKLYGIENYLKNSPPVEKEVMRTMIEVFDSETQLAFLNISPEYLTDESENIIYVKDWLPSVSLCDGVYDEIYNEDIKPNEYKTENLVNYSFDEPEPFAEEEFLDFEDYFVLEILAMYAAERTSEDEFLVNDVKNSVEREKQEAVDKTKLSINPLPLPALRPSLSSPISSPKSPPISPAISPDFNQSKSADTSGALNADIKLEGYNPQNPVVDAMRTALFDMPEVDKSAWSELSIWNRSFSNRIKTSSVDLFPERAPYKFRFIMQKDKTAPVAIIYPSIGEGIMSHHSVIMAKIFYDKGYSVIIQGSHFQWEFVKSMPEDYRPGVPSRDIDYIKMATTKIINTLQDKYNCEFSDKVVIGTSFGAMTTLFLAEKEWRNNTLNISRFISVNPPVELLYAMNQIDKNTAEWNKNPDNLRDRVAITAAKVLQLLQAENLPKDKIESLPFSEEEAKLITGFIMHQKLSDLIFTIENGHKANQAELYEKIRSMNYQEYAKKYLLSDKYKTLDDIALDTSLHAISDYLRNNNNYKIYHALDDYLVSPAQLKKLRNYCGNRVVLMSHGSHLGFMYRKEFIESLKRDITRENVQEELAEGKI